MISFWNCRRSFSYSGKFLKKSEEIGGFGIPILLKYEFPFFKWKLKFCVYFFIYKKTYYQEIPRTSPITVNGIRILKDKINVKADPNKNNNIFSEKHSRHGFSPDVFFIWIFVDYQFFVIFICHKKSTMTLCSGAIRVLCMSRFLNLQNFIKTIQKMTLTLIMGF